MLGGATHYQQVAGGRFEADAWAAGLWTHAEGARSAEADDRNERVDLGSSNAVGVPGNAVLAGLVVIAEESSEWHLVMGGEG